MRNFEQKISDLFDAQDGFVDMSEQFGIKQQKRQKSKMEAANDIVKMIGFDGNQF